MLSVLTSTPHNNDNLQENQHADLRILFIVESKEAVVSLNPDRLSYSCIAMDEALRAVEEQTPGAILVWSQVSGKHSADLTRLRDFARVNAIPFLFYSPGYTAADRKNAMKYGVDDYVWGPLAVNFADKIAAIRKVKEYNRSRKTASLDRYRFRPGREMIPAKRAMDILLSLCALLLLSPVLLVVAVIIKLESRGPIFYISKRAGNGYRVFDFYKFRSMRQDADKQLSALAAQNQYGNSAFFKIKNDPRITRFGNFLRMTSIDELPQLINVLKGDMSLVGNRPLPLYEAEKLTRDGIAYRFLAPAGITGLWQITKRGKEEMSEEERIRLDMIYARKYSFMYDLKILMGTLPALLQKEKV
jgi:lipopolysaccharide/colanic/teichoic acid biosynthesis glycosyltransferase